MALSYNRTYVENQSTGKALEGVVVRVYLNNVLQSVFADESSTPLPTVLTGEDGSAVYYVDGDGVYEEEYLYNGDILDRVRVTIFNPANYAPGADVDAILGAPAVDGDLGTFTGATIPDNSSAKGALQALETATELRPTSTTLAATGGSALVGFLQAGTGAVARTAQAKQREVLSIDDFGADPTGATDSLPALLLAIAAAPTGSTIYFPGTYRFTATAGTVAVTLTKALTFLGPSDRVGNIADGNLARGFLYFDTNVSTAIYANDVTLCLDGVNVSGLGVGVSTGIGVSCTGINSAIHIVNGALIQNFKDGLNASAGDYVKIERSTISYCERTVVADGCFNFNIIDSHIRPEGAGSIGIVASTNSQINVIGGAIESYQQYGWAMVSGSRINLNGVYYEAGATGAWNGFLSDNCAVYERACYVYMTTCLRHISAEGSGTLNYAIDSKFNEFVPETTARRVDYYTFKQSEPTIFVEVSGHRYVSTATPGANNNWLNPDFIAAFPDFAQGVGHFVVDYPVGVTGYGQGKNTLLDVVDPALASLGTPKVLTAAGFKAADAASDPIGIRAVYGTNAPYRAVYSNGQWEKVGLRMANQTDASGGATVDAEARTAINGLLAKLRSAGVMI